MTRLDLIVIAALLVLVVVIPTLLATLLAPVWAGLWYVGLACWELTAYLAQRWRS